MIGLAMSARHPPRLAGRSRVSVSRQSCLERSLARVGRTDSWWNVCESTNKQNTLEDYLNRAALLVRIPRWGDGDAVRYRAGRPAVKVGRATSLSTRFRMVVSSSLPSSSRSQIFFLSMANFMER